MKKILAALIVFSPEWLAALCFKGRRKVIDDRTIDAKAMAVGELSKLVTLPFELFVPVAARSLTENSARSESNLI